LAAEEKEGKNVQKWVNFFRGNIRLEISGAFPERFLNLCSVERLGFWAVEQEDQTVLRLTVALWDLRRAEALAQKAGCTLRRLEGRGLPLMLYALRRRYGLLAGAALSTAAAVFLSQFILVVNVTGNTLLSDSVILTELEELGLHFGTYGPGLDERAVSNEMLERLPELSFLSVNVRGVYAEVVVHESDPTPQLRDEDTPTDVVASRDGIVLDVNAYAGSVEVEAGTAVLAGEVLISHYSVFPPAEWSDGATYTDISHARGQVWAVTERTFSAKMPLQTDGSVEQTEAARRYRLRIGKNIVKFYGNSSNFTNNCVKIERAWRATLPGGILLPLVWEQETLLPLSSQRAAVTADSAEGYLKACLLSRMETVVGEGELLTQNWTVTEEDGALTVTLNASCREDIAKEQTVTEDALSGEMEMD
jgi:similar to stage IV sporulation protein